MILYDASTIATAPFPDTEEGRAAKSFLVPLFQRGPEAWFEDRARMLLLGMDDLLIPLSLTDGSWNNSYLFSMYARYIASQRNAIKTGNWKPLAGFTASSALWGVGAVMKATRLDKVIQVDTWPSMRNMGANLTADQARRLTEFLTTRFPDHALVFMALNPATHSPLLNNLKGQGYAFSYMTHTRMLLPAGLDPGASARKLRRRDARMTETSGYQVLDGRDVPGCAPRLAELYRMLNREKYMTNPPNTQAFFEDLLQGTRIPLRLLVKDGRVDAFYGISVKDEVLYSPVSGYDLTLPQDVGLYRMLNSLLMMEAFDRGIAIETGGGSDPFKSLRGDRPLPRYNAVYLRHLPSYRHIAWRLVDKLGNESLLGFSRKRLREVDGEANVVGFDGIPETFAPPFLSPRESVALLNRELESLERDVEATANLTGKERTRHVVALHKRLEEEQLPRPRVARLRERLKQLEHDSQTDKKQRKKGPKDDPRADVARHLLEAATTVGGTTVVCHHLGEAPEHPPRTLAELLGKASTPTAVVLTATRGGTVEFATAATPQLVALGVDASALLTQLTADGPPQGGAELAWAEGSHPEDITGALERARGFLQTRLTAPS
ncbi:GNAT family N-acetyltransferase [Corallococcus praedator]|uniref:GNAT family N-acetyltransferase n=1 Tax=Corallococcus praedator TaxID=2316724 RepID=A0ABX9QJX0_9BACT|nr:MULTISPECIES: GNAT family N-acetyltransferase [Corallococcus]RKH31647.1 GNAT family N-acetyltransferase [Corallococcus sp. CA031C]RKI10725.1 GNAT family N-acetyltransferase [Corallococcus praedator]